MPIVEFTRVSKSFGAPPARAVDAVTFAVRRGEFFSLLGPSGCGKTTTLRLLAGFEEPDPGGGGIRIAGEPACGKRPYERRLGMVFQSYALFPHLSVGRNVAFGLERHGRPAAEIPGRVAAALEMVRLDPAVFTARRPAELSGGQRQRVALARALVLQPEILLLDEPLGAIDLKLRKAMQLELKELNRRLGITFVYVTHDQDEALAMSDRIAVMDRGRIAQLGSPAEIYESPRTAFVASFIGESNLLGGKTERRKDGMWEMVTPTGWRLAIPERPGLSEGVALRLAIRPEWMDLGPPGAAPSGANALAGAVDDVIYQGEMIRILVALEQGGARLTIALRNEGQLGRPLAWARGDAVLVTWRPEDGQLLEEE
ncbi:MAG TPA: ABC transporter ATP-binding protein [Gemmatimonadales bacterium]|nr:ABC transporter ATP-binding protein [Gemmatimonadales bacterium]